MTGKVKFCVFAGREKNIKILNFYIEEALSKNIIDEYHIFNFSRNKDDENFLKNQYTILILKYPERIFIHNNPWYISMKTNWSPFYKYIATTSYDEDIIIKCDDDILFIDIDSLEYAINERRLDKVSFLIHSNCINNGICAYYQRHLFPKIEDKLEVYPTGGLLGILFENPLIPAVIHTQFTNDLIEDINSINKYYVKDVYIVSRISINFILILGSDCKYLKDVIIDDEYKLSSFIPEQLLRPNKIIGNFITAHYSYSIQDYFIEKRKDIYLNYLKIKELYSNRIIKKKEVIKKKILNIPSVYFAVDEIFKVKNWYKNNNYYIKNIETNQYIYINFFKDNLVLSSDLKSVFEINFENKNICSIKLGVYYLTNENYTKNFKNEHALLKCYKNENYKSISIIDCEYENNNGINLYFLNNEVDKKCFSIDGNKIWKFEEISYKSDEYFYVKRFIKNDKYYYQDINTNQIYTNFYLGWGIDTLFHI